VNKRKNADVIDTIDTTRLSDLTKPVDPVPCKLQTESGELNEQVKGTFILQKAKSAGVS